MDGALTERCLAPKVSDTEGVGEGSRHFGNSHPCRIRDIIISIDALLESLRKGGY